MASLALEKQTPQFDDKGSEAKQVLNWLVQHAVRDLDTMRLCYALEELSGIGAVVQVAQGLVIVHERGADRAHLEVHQGTQHHGKGLADGKSQLWVGGAGKSIRRACIATPINIENMLHACIGERQFRCLPAMRPARAQLLQMIMPFVMAERLVEIEPAQMLLSPYTRQRRRHPLFREGDNLRRNASACAVAQQVEQGDGAFRLHPLGRDSCRLGCKLALVASHRRHVLCVPRRCLIKTRLDAAQLSIETTVLKRHPTVAALHVDAVLSCIVARVQRVHPRLLWRCHRS